MELFMQEPSLHSGTEKALTPVAKRLRPKNRASEMQKAFRIIVLDLGCISLKIKHNVFDVNKQELYACRPKAKTTIIIKQILCQHS